MPNRRAYFICMTITRTPRTTVSKIRGFKKASLTSYIHNTRRELIIYQGNRRGRDHMVVGYTTTCPISAYHH